MVKRQMMIDSAKIKLNLPRKSENMTPVQVYGLKVNLKDRSTNATPQMHMMNQHLNVNSHNTSLPSFNGSVRKKGSERKNHKINLTKNIHRIINNNIDMKVKQDLKPRKSPSGVPQIDLFQIQKSEELKTIEATERVILSPLKKDECSPYRTPTD